jgi:hypothetical protein
MRRAILNGFYVGSGLIVVTITAFFTWGLLSKQATVDQVGTTVVILNLVCGAHLYAQFVYWFGGRRKWNE